MKLAKVIIAIAWADGEVTNDEINSLKDLIFHLPRIGAGPDGRLSAEEWNRLEMYIESPVGADERTRLVADLQDALRSSEQKKLALEALQKVVEADGLVSSEEAEVLGEVRQAIESAEVGLVSDLGRLMGFIVQSRSASAASAPNREVFFEDFVKNKVYFAVSQRLQLEKAELNIPENELRKLSLAGGLMAKVAHVDREVSDGEFEGIVRALRTYWGISLEEATLVAEIAVSAIDVNYDIFRMLRELASWTTVDERRRFLDILFEISMADGALSNDEAEEIRRIARGLNLTHKDYINAKVRRHTRPNSAAS